MEDQSMVPSEAARGEKWAFFMPKIGMILRVAAFYVLTVLAGCAAYGPGENWYDMNTTGSGAEMSSSDKFDVRLEKTEISPISGASARVLPPPLGVTYTGSPVGACVTEAGYCPLAAETEPGQNCLCQAASGMYGGTTGVPRQFGTPINQP